MTHGSLFSGIGGFDLAARWAGIETLFTCEIDEWLRDVLKYYHPNATHHEDIFKTKFKQWRGRIDIVSAGIPCQSVSNAGYGTADDFIRFWQRVRVALREIKPAWFVLENVYGLVTSRNGAVLNQVLCELEADGYAVQPFTFTACAFGSPQPRERIFVVAHHDKVGSLKGERQEPSIKPVEGVTDWEGFSAQSLSCSRTDGIPVRLDGTTVPRPLATWRKRSLEAYGNCVVPHIPKLIFETIKRVEEKSYEKENNRNRKKRNN